MGTQGADGRKPFSFSLRIHLATAFMGLVGLVGTLTAVHTYQAGARLLLSAGSETFTHAARETDEQIRGLLLPARLQLELLARHPIAGAATLAERLSSAPTLTSAMAGNPQLAAIYIGYENGDYFQLRRPLPADLPAVPPGTAFLVQSIEAGAARSLVLDRDLHALAESAGSVAEYEPRVQRWFYRATPASGVVRTDVNVQAGAQLVSTSFSLRTPDQNSVVGMDMSLDDLSARLRDYRLTPSTRIALIDGDGHVIAHPDKSVLLMHASAKRARLANVFEIGEEPLAEIFTRMHGRDHRTEFDIGGRSWISQARAMLAEGGAPVFMLLAVPQDEILVEAGAIARGQLQWTLLAVLVAMPVVWLLSRALSRPLERLASGIQAIRTFDFAAAEPLRSRIIEVDDLARVMDAMRGTIRQFMETSAALAAEMRLDKVLYRVLRDTADAARARRACLYLADGSALQRAAMQAEETDTVPAYLPERLSLDDESDHACVRAARSGSTVLAPVAAGTAGMLLCVPLQTREGELVGLLLLELEVGRVGTGGGRDPLVAFVESLSGAAAVAIETRHLIKAQKDLLDALIEIVAAAIDAKSPYTGGHCQRVPVLAEMLADAACKAREGPFRDFALDAEERETLKVAAWLHDCGKVTTPEYVVDKAVKLETLYNRLHEIRMRFELLKRDAEIACWKAVVAGAAREESLRALEQTWRTLDEEFAFIAECNTGGETMSEQSKSRVHQIASRTWVRTLDDGIGLSEDERRRRVTPVAPPAVEYLLADKVEHIVPRPADEVMAADNPWEFKLEVPHHKFNLGEIYNLCVSRGTLTEEERFLINDHIVQTIIMLSKLPFPRHLRQVPEIAGGHHERIDGRGYPKRLKGEQLSVPARIMAIADIYEALTATDRPYKRGKTLSESLQIMRAMAVNRHIDADLYNLFLESGSFHRYADRFLAARQIDEVDIAALRV